ncbi:MAG TPA: hypothetical protein VGN74_03480 [Brevundimonas sp.]|jgi:hypothetical protein|uniref:hypothetical protein n=1 Tax=Brevundimonas sp. TaxID=1871086 RepID=UPI002E1325FE|nr:hypothetical protein [Brevundimonas sp.]
MRQTRKLLCTAAAVVPLTLAPSLAAAAPFQDPAPTAPVRTAEELTRDLNSGPPFPTPARPAPAASPAPTPTPTPTPSPAPNPTADALTRDLNTRPPAAAATRPVTPAPAAVVPTPAPAVAPPVRAAPAATPPAREAAPVAAAPAVTPAAAPLTAPVREGAATPEAAPAPTPTPAPTPAPPPAPTLRALDAAAIGRLPFALTLPAGTEIIETPSGQSFDTWAVRRGETTLLRLYAGPASQFPIYDGEVRTVGERSTVVVTDGAARRAMEHLFERDGATPREIHVLVATLTGGDLALAEAIGQSVDPR